MAPVLLCLTGSPYDIESGYIHQGLRITFSLVT